MDITKAVNNAISAYNKAQSFNGQLETRQTAASAVTRLFHSTRLSTIAEIGVPYIPKDVYELLPQRVKEDMYIVRDINRKNFKLTRTVNRILANKLLGALRLQKMRDERRNYNGRGTATLESVVVYK